MQGYSFSLAYAEPRSAVPAGVCAANAPAGDAKVDQIVMALLRNGLDAIGDSNATASASIARAFDLLETAWERSDTGTSRPGGDRGALAPWQVKRLATFVDARLDGPISVQQLSAVAKLSPNYFCRAFKSSFGRSPHAYVLDRRLEKARELLLATDEPLSRVALTCGFSDQAHFTRRFRQAMGAPPNAWRRQWLGGRVSAQA